MDPELDDESIVECLAVTREAGIEKAFEDVAKKELGVNARTWESLGRRAVDRRQAAATGEPTTTDITEPGSTDAAEPADSVDPAPLSAETGPA